MDSLTSVNNVKESKNLSDKPKSPRKELKNEDGFASISDETKESFYENESPKESKKDDRSELGKRSIEDTLETIDNRSFSHKIDEERSLKILKTDIDKPKSRKKELKNIDFDNIIEYLKQFNCKEEVKKIMQM